ncbi:hypothetical protein DGG96_16090 [Legionella qingyii]|uniref:Uncharacterized protein n=1 Tax=Legionella qingyii TaxID=2184757 RepID=A0A317TZL2_9GAMM|nr:hypothetical protein DGG96_18455 [Legionella qingyii]PWY54529.1 hypothetical protein DGG96_16090 [Legionella qingyii]
MHVTAVVRWNLTEHEKKIIELGVVVPIKIFIPKTLVESFMLSLLIGLQREEEVMTKEILNEVSNSYLDKRPALKKPY